jgi:hypothetical protein
VIPDEPATLLEALTAAAAGLPDVTAQAGSHGTEWSVRRQPFATAGGDVAEFRLEPAIVRAALGTPDTSPSARGPDWVAFRPAELDRFALDRARAWLASAHRRAAALRN